MGRKEKFAVAKAIAALFQIPAVPELIDLENALYKALTEQSDREKYKRKLLESLEQLSHSENLTDAQSDALNKAIECLFNDIAILEYYPDNAEGLLAELQTRFKEEDEAFLHICKIIINACFDNISQINTAGAIAARGAALSHDEHQEQNAVLQNHSELLHEIRDAVKTPFTPPTSPTPISNNDIYEKRYKAPLFLESEIKEEDSKSARLHKVFVEPALCSQRWGTLQDMLLDWMGEPDEDSDEDAIADYSILLLYGKAGIGKSSYTSRIISAVDANGNKVFGDCWLALELRQHHLVFHAQHAWESIKYCFQCENDAAYANRCLILDGLDEVRVLHPDFDAVTFLNSLQEETALKKYNIKILITSREGYFEDDELYSRSLRTAYIQWGDAQLEEWCGKYCGIHKIRDDWKEKFLADFRELAEDDKRRDIFCIPMILYLCCVRMIEIAENKSVVDIYERAFREIGSRGHHTSTAMQESDERTFSANWEFTKELAYRIFLDGEVTVLGDEGIGKAREKTKLKYPECEPELSRYFAIFPFASDTAEGMEFAHKTVTEYFTAVKLYEDYFEDCNSPESFWERVWSAFRYREMPDDVIAMLVQLIESRQGEHLAAWRASFFACYYEGVKRQCIWMCLSPPEYVCRTYFPQLPQQVGLAFRNLTHLLSRLGYENRERKPEDAVDEDYALGLSFLFPRGIMMNVSCDGWQGFRNVHLYGAYLMYAHLHDADLRDAYLWGANLRYADLSDANLHDADLHDADLREAGLSFADLRDADLRGADLMDAILRHADLREADLREADLRDADLMDADLRRADLNDADLRGADLTVADLRGARLCGADLHDANLTDADLTEADLCRADLRGAFWSFGQELHDIELYDTDLPQLDEAIETYGIKLIEPRVISKETGKYLRYNPETNRAE